MENPKVEFIRFYSASGDDAKLWQNVCPPPRPAADSMPDWYKEARSYKNDIGLEWDEDSSSVTGSQTFKKCIPFREAMTIGYMFFIGFDIVIRQLDDEGTQWSWDFTAKKGASHHAEHQIKEIPVMDGFAAFGLKFMNPWIIKTPPGYSSLIVQPLNRADIKFFPYAGVIDTDQYMHPINGIFQVKKMKKAAFKVIRAGSPLFQVIPFKRENWTHSIEDVGTYGEESQKQLAQLSRGVNHTYRDNWNVKKSYK